MERYRKRPLVFAIFVTVVVCLIPRLAAGQFKSADDALKILDGLTECKCDTDQEVYKYFAAHKDESIPVLLAFAAANPQRLFIAVGALARIKDDRSFLFLQDLLSHPSDSSGRVSQSGLIRLLGDYGDQRALGSLRSFRESVDIDTRESSEVALCKLGDITVGELVTYFDRDGERIRKIASVNIYGNPAFAVKLLDWIIANPSDGDGDVYYLHIDKAQALLNLEDYSRLSKEGDFIFRNFGDRAKVQDLNIGHTGVPLAKIVEQANQKRPGH